MLWQPGAIPGPRALKPPPRQGGHRSLPSPVAAPVGSTAEAALGGSPRRWPPVFSAPGGGLTVGPPLRIAFARPPGLLAVRPPAAPPGGGGWQDRPMSLPPASLPPGTWQDRPMSLPPAGGQAWL
jgi:hypothetical protein